MIITTKTCCHICHRPNHLSEDNEQLLKKYPPPFGSDFGISRVLLEPTLTSNNYRARMHDLLYVEEIAQYANISRSVGTSVICWGSIGINE